MLHIALAFTHIKGRNNLMYSADSWGSLELTLPPKLWCALASFPFQLQYTTERLL